MKKRPRGARADHRRSDPDLERLSSALELATLTAFERDRAQALYRGSGPAKPVRVVIEVDAARADEARRILWGDEQTIRSPADGGVSVSFVCSDFAPIIARVLRFGSHARVKSPKALVERVVQTLDAALVVYRR